MQWRVSCLWRPHEPGAGAVQSRPQEPRRYMVIPYKYPRKAFFATSGEAAEDASLMIGDLPQSTTSSSRRARGDDAAWRLEARDRGCYVRLRDSRVECESRTRVIEEPVAAAGERR